MAKLTPGKLIKDFFGTEEQPVTLAELMKLGKENRHELALLIAEHEGVTLDETYTG